MAVLRRSWLQRALVKFDAIAVRTNESDWSGRKQTGGQVERNFAEEKDIEPHVPVWDKTERKNDSFSSNDFHWNEET
jgi:hypothetical protein